MGLRLPATPKNCLPRRGISILEKLIKTCPVWLQLGLSRTEAARILHREVAGVSQQQQAQLQELGELHGEAAACRQLPIFSPYSTSATRCVSQSSAVGSAGGRFRTGEQGAGGRRDQ